MSALPKFSFKALNLSDEQIATTLAPEAGQRTESKFFRPGRHTTTIISSTYMGQASDDTWSKWVVKYEGTSGKTITDMIMVPTSKLTYRDRNGKESNFALVRLNGLVDSLGLSLNSSSLESTLATLFGKENALAGKSVDIVAGYDGIHIVYVGKKEDGSKRYALAFRSGDLREGCPEFSDYDTATTYCKENNIELKRFTDVMSYAKSSTTTTASKNSDW